MSTGVVFTSDENGVWSFRPPCKRADRYNRVLTEWVTAGSLTEAMLRAGYAPMSARRQGVRLRARFPGIVEEVQRRRRAVAEKIELDQAAVVLELARIAFADISKIVSWEDGKPVVVDSELLSPDTRAAIQEISIGADGAMKVRLHDKRAALVGLGKFMGLGRDDNRTLAALLARLAGTSEGEVLEAQRLDAREAARRVALLLRKGRKLRLEECA